MATRRFPARLIQLLSLVLCYSLLFSTLLIVRPPASLAGSAQGQAQRGTPVPGPPAANLPNLDEVRSKRQPQPQAPPQLPSTLRARRKPLVPRNGLKVGDPGTTLGVVQVRTGSGSDRVTGSGAHANDQTSNSNAEDAKYSAKDAASLPLRSSAKTFAASALKSPPSLPPSQRARAA